MADTDSLSSIQVKGSEDQYRAVAEEVEALRAELSGRPTVQEVK